MWLIFLRLCAGGLSRSLARSGRAGTVPPSATASLSASLFRAALTADAALSPKGPRVRISSSYGSVWGPGRAVHRAGTPAPGRYREGAAPSRGPCAADATAKPQGSPLSPPSCPPPRPQFTIRLLTDLAPDTCSLVQELARKGSCPACKCGAPCLRVAGRVLSVAAGFLLVMS